MLPAGSRLTRREDFASAVRRGRRSGRSTLVVHLDIVGASAAGPVRATDATGCARAGLVVSRAVGGSVVRHRVARRLRHLVADRLGGLPARTRLVVRALPAAADATSAQLGVDLDAALRGASRKTAGSTR